MVKRIHVSHLEGLAAVGMLKKFWVEDCEYPGAKRFLAVTVNGETVETRCVDERAAKKVVLYLAEAKGLSGLVVQGSAEDREEVFVEE